nr:Ig-like domain-containing protein [Salinicola acroporae]
MTETVRPTTPPGRADDIDQQTGDLDSGDLDSGDITNDDTPTLDGQAEAGSIVTIFANGNEIGTMMADNQGNWAFTTDNLDDGDYSFTATATDAAGNVSETSDPFALTIDTQPPSPQIDSIAFEDGGDGRLSAEEVGSTGFTGHVEPGDTVDSIVISDANGETITASGDDITVDREGSFRVTPRALFSLMSDSRTDQQDSSSQDENLHVTPQDLSELQDGMLTVTLTVEDIAGNTIRVTDSSTLDTHAPTVSVDVPDTDDTHVPITGKVEDANADLVVTIDGEGHNATNNGDGTWIIDQEDIVLNERDHDISVLAIDLAGNEASDADTVTVDITAPAPPTVDSATDDASLVTGNLTSGDAIVPFSAALPKPIVSSRSIPARPNSARPSPMRRESGRSRQRHSMTATTTSPRLPPTALATCLSPTTSAAKSVAAC